MNLETLKSELNVYEMDEITSGATSSSSYGTSEGTSEGTSIGTSTTTTIIIVTIEEDI